MPEWDFPAKGYIESTEKLYYHTMTMKDLRERLKKNDVIIVPAGSTENHGDSGPLGEDTFIVSRVAEMIARRTGCTVASPLWYGSHPYQQLGQPGTVPIPDDVYHGYIRAVITGLWNAGFRKQIWLNIHGQEYTIPVAIQEWGKKFQIPALIYFVDFARVMGDTIKDKAHGGPYDNPFKHADEAEQSISLALFPEFCDQSSCQETNVTGLMPHGYIDLGGDALGYPICGHCTLGNAGCEYYTAPEGILGRPADADPEKARPSIEKLCDFIESLHNEILKIAPAGKMPPTERFTQRDPELIEQLYKGPHNGGKHVYTIAWPT